MLLLSVVTGLLLVLPGIQSYVHRAPNGEYYDEYLNIFFWKLVYL